MGRRVVLAAAFLLCLLLTPHSRNVSASTATTQPPATLLDPVPPDGTVYIRVNISLGGVNTSGIDLGAIQEEVALINFLPIETVFVTVAGESSLTITIVAEATNKSIISYILQNALSYSLLIELQELLPNLTNLTASRIWVETAPAIIVPSPSPGLLQGDIAAIAIGIATFLSICYFVYVIVTRNMSFPRRSSQQRWWPCCHRYNSYEQSLSVFETLA